MTTIPESTWEEARRLATFVMNVSEGTPSDSNMVYASEEIAHALHRARQEATEKAAAVCETNYPVYVTGKGFRMEANISGERHVGHEFAAAIRKAFRKSRPHA